MLPKLSQSDDSVNSDCGGGAIIMVAVADLIVVVVVGVLEVFASGGNSVSSCGSCSNDRVIGSDGVRSTKLLNFKRQRVMPIPL